MDARRLGEVLKATLSATGARQQAEATLKKLGRTATPGFTSTLLKIVAQGDAFEFGVRQLAIIHLKNIVGRYWTVKDMDVSKGPRISPQDRATIKRNIIETVIQQSTRKIRVQLLEVVFVITRADFPMEWQGLMPQLLKNIQSKNPTRMYGAFCALHQVFKVYEFRDKKRFGPLREIGAKLFPIMLPIFQSLANAGTQSSYEMMRILIKIFRLATHREVIPYFRDPANMAPWVKLLLGLVARPLKQRPPAGAELKALPQMKCKKWSVYSLTSIYTRWGTEAFQEDAQDKALARVLNAHFAKPTLQMVMGTLLAASKGEPVTDRIRQECFSMLRRVLRLADLYALIRPHLKFIIGNCILGSQMLSKQDLIAWRDDPQEYVRRDMDVMEEYTDARCIARYLLKDLVRVRTSDTLKLTLGIISAIFSEFQAKNPQQRDYRKKEAAMHMLSTLAALLLSEEKYQGGVENIIAQFILPEFKSPHGFMRGRACNVVGQFSKLEFKDPRAFQAAARGVCESLASKDMPLKLHAIIAVSRLVHEAGFVAQITPHIGMVLKEYFDVLQDVANEEVVSTLEVLVEQVGKPIGRFAVQIAQRMVGTFLQMLEGASQDDDEAAMTALKCLNVLVTLLLVVKELGDDIYTALERIVAPVIDKCLCFDGIEFLEDTLDMVGAIVKYKSSVSPFLWSLVPRICKLYAEYAVDHVQNVVVALGNYIKYGARQLVGKPQMLQAILAVIRWTFNPKGGQVRKGAGRVDFLVPCQYMAKLMGMLLANCRLAIDPIVPQIIQITVTELDKATKLYRELKESPDEDLNVHAGHALVLKGLLLETVAGALFYKPTLFLQVTQKLGCTKTLFGLWMSSLNEMESAEAKGVSALGLLSLAILPPNALEDRMLLQLFNGGVRQLAEIKALEEQTNEDEDTEEEIDEQEEFQDVAAGQDAFDDDDIQTVKDFASRLRQVWQAAGAHNDSYLDDFFTTVDGVDKFSFFAQALARFNMVNKQAYAAWTGSLSSNQKQVVQQLVGLGRKRAAEAAAASQAGASGSNS